MSENLRKHINGTPWQGIRFKCARLHRTYDNVSSNAYYNTIYDVLRSRGWRDVNAQEYLCIDRRQEEQLNIQNEVGILVQRNAGNCGGSSGNVNGNVNGNNGTTPAFGGGYSNSRAPSSSHSGGVGNSNSSSNSSSKNSSNYHSGAGHSAFDGLTGKKTAGSSAEGSPQQSSPDSGSCSSSSDDEISDCGAQNRRGSSHANGGKKREGRHREATPTHILSESDCNPSDPLTSESEPDCLDSRELLEFEILGRLRDGDRHDVEQSDSRLQEGQHNAAFPSSGSMGSGGGGGNHGSGSSLESMGNTNHNAFGNNHSVMNSNGIVNPNGGSGPNGGKSTSHLSEYTNNTITNALTKNTPTTLHNPFVPLPVAEHSHVNISQKKDAAGLVITRGLGDLTHCLDNARENLANAYAARAAESQLEGILSQAERLFGAQDVGIDKMTMVRNCRRAGSGACRNGDGKPDCVADGTNSGGHSSPQSSNEGTHPNSLMYRGQVRGRGKNIGSNINGKQGENCNAKGGSGNAGEDSASSNGFIFDAHVAEQLSNAAFPGLIDQNASTQSLSTKSPNATTSAVQPPYFSPHEVNQLFMKQQNMGLYQNNLLANGSNNSPGSNMMPGFNFAGVHTSPVGTCANSMQSSDQQQLQLSQQQSAYHQIQSQQSQQNTEKMEIGSNRWNIYWADKDWIHLEMDKVHLLPGQRVNHYRNHQELTRKDLLAKNVKRARRALEKEASTAGMRENNVDGSAGNDKTGKSGGGGGGGNKNMNDDTTGNNNNAFSSNDIAKSASGKDISTNHIDENGNPTNLLLEPRSWTLKERYLEEAKKFDIIPLTFTLPHEYSMFAESFRKVGGVWIMKPVGRSQGAGIFIVTKLSQVSAWSKTSSAEGEKSAPVETYVVQKYVEKPLLIGGKKFDLRLYVLVTSYNPLTVWLHRGGFARFSVSQYTTSHKDMSSHLTNIAVQKKGKDATYERTGAKWDLKRIRQYWEQTLGPGRTAALMCSIESVILHSLFAVQKVMIADRHAFELYGYSPQVMIADRHAFELYGYDILIDSNLRPLLLEVNASPSLTANTASDYEMKFSLLDDMLTILDLEGYFTKASAVLAARKLQHKKELQARREIMLRKERGVGRGGGGGGNTFGGGFGGGSGGGGGSGPGVSNWTLLAQEGSFGGGGVAKSGAKTGGEKGGKARGAGGASRGKGRYATTGARGSVTGGNANLTSGVGGGTSINSRNFTSGTGGGNFNSGGNSSTNNTTNVDKSSRSAQQLNQRKKQHLLNELRNRKLLAASGRGASNLMFGSGSTHNRHQIRHQLSKIIRSSLTKKNLHLPNPSAILNSVLVAKTRQTIRARRMLRGERIMTSNSNGNGSGYSDGSGSKAIRTTKIIDKHIQRITLLTAVRVCSYGTTKKHFTRYFQTRHFHKRMRGGEAILPPVNNNVLNVHSRNLTALQTALQVVMRANGNANHADSSSTSGTEFSEKLKTAITNTGSTLREYQEDEWQTSQKMKDRGTFLLKMKQKSEQHSLQLENRARLRARQRMARLSRAKQIINSRRERREFYGRGGNAGMGNNGVGGSDFLNNDRSNSSSTFSTAFCSQTAYSPFYQNSQRSSTHKRTALGSSSFFQSNLQPSIRWHSRTVGGTLSTTTIKSLLLQRKKTFTSKLKSVLGATSSGNFSGSSLLGGSGGSLGSYSGGTGIGGSSKLMAGTGKSGVSGKLQSGLGGSGIISSSSALLRGTASSSSGVGGKKLPSRFGSSSSSGAGNTGTGNSGNSGNTSGGNSANTSGGFVNSITQIGGFDCIWRSGPIKQKVRGIANANSSSNSNSENLQSALSTTAAGSVLACADGAGRRGSSSTASLRQSAIVQTHKMLGDLLTEMEKSEMSSQSNSHEGGAGGGNNNSHEQALPSSMFSAEQIHNVLANLPVNQPEVVQRNGLAQLGLRFPGQVAHHYSLSQSPESDPFVTIDHDGGDASQSGHPGSAHLPFQRFHQSQKLPTNSSSTATTPPTFPPHLPSGHLQHGSLLHGNQVSGINSNETIKYRTAGGCNLSGDYAAGGWYSLGEHPCYDPKLGTSADIGVGENPFSMVQQGAAGGETGNGFASGAGSNNESNPGANNIDLFPSNFQPSNAANKSGNTINNSGSSGNPNIDQSSTSIRPLGVNFTSQSVNKFGISDYTGTVFDLSTEEERRYREHYVKSTGVSSGVSGQQPPSHQQSRVFTYGLNMFKYDYLPLYPSLSTDDLTINRNALLCPDDAFEKVVTSTMVGGGNDDINVNASASVGGGGSSGGNLASTQNHNGLQNNPLFVGPAPLLNMLNANSSVSSNSSSANRTARPPWDSERNVLATMMPMPLTGNLLTSAGLIASDGKHPSSHLSNEVNTDQEEGPASLNNINIPDPNSLQKFPLLGNSRERSREAGAGSTKKGASNQQGASTGNNSSKTHHWIQLSKSQKLAFVRNWMMLMHGNAGIAGIGGIGAAGGPNGPNTLLLQDTNINSVGANCFGSNTSLIQTTSTVNKENMEKKLVSNFNAVATVTYPSVSKLGCENNRQEQLKRLAKRMAVLVNGG